MAQYPTAVATDSDLYVAVNQLSTVLNGSLDASQTTVTVTSTTGFPTVGFITVDSEVIKYTSTNSTQFLSCTRGADGTGATTHSSGATVKHAVTAAHHNALKDEVKAVETALGVNLSNVVQTSTNQTVAGIKSFSNTIKQTAGTSQISIDATSSTAQIGNNYNLGTIPNASNTSANINLDCPTTNATVKINTSATANTAPTEVASFSNAGSSIKGTTTNDNAAAGNVGEYISSNASINFATSGNYTDITSISLTAGDWDISGQFYYVGVSGDVVTEYDGGISTTSGNSATGLTFGVNAFTETYTTGNTNLARCFSVAPYRFSFSTTTTVYLKCKAVYTGTAPQNQGRISARRVR